MFFSIIVQKLLVIYVNILLGFLCSKALKVSGNDIAKLIFYIITPFVTLQGVLKADLDGGANLLLPLIVFVICCILCVSFYIVAGRFWNNPIRNVVAMSAGTGNSGFIGLPVAMIVTNNNNDLVGLYIIAMLGMSIYENTLGFFMISKGEYSIQECAKRIFRLPIIYTFLIGAIINIMGYRIHDLPTSLVELLTYAQGCYLTLGTLIIGIALGQVEKFSVDRKFLCITFLAKFIFWPLAIYGLIYIDKNFLMLFDENVHRVVMILSIVPIATNTVTLSMIFKLYPEKSATTVLLGAIFAIFYIPLLIEFMF